LEDVLVEAAERVMRNTFDRFLKRITKTDFYRHLYRMLGNDGGISDRFADLCDQLIISIQNEARTECDRYVRESPRFYDEGTFSIYQFRQTLNQTSQSYDCESMMEAEPAIRQLLKLDFEPKVNQTIRRNFRQTFNQTLKTQFIPLGEQVADDILQQYDRARSHREQTLEQEVQEMLSRNRQEQKILAEKIKRFNQSVEQINTCLQGAGLETLLPVLTIEVEPLE
jgi:bacterioferritin (cytochrome b1)